MPLPLFALSFHPNATLKLLAFNIYLGTFVNLKSKIIDEKIYHIDICRRSFFCERAG